MRTLWATAMVAVLVAAMAQGAVAVRAKAVCKSSSYELANRSAEKFEHEFQILNDGNGPLRFSALKTTHQSIVARLSRWQVDPGGSASISVSGPTGLFAKEPRQAVTVATNDPNQPVLTLLLIATPSGSTTAPAATKADAPKTLPAASTTNAEGLMKMAKRICEGDAGATAELANAMETLYRGIDLRSDRARLASIRDALEPAMELLGEQASTGNEKALAAMKSLLLISRYSQSLIAEALGTAATKNEQALEVLVQPKQNGLLVSCAVAALRKPATTGNAKAVAFLIEVLEDPANAPLASLTLNSLRPAAAAGSAEAKAAVERHSKPRSR